MATRIAQVKFITNKKLQLWKFFFRNVDTRRMKLQAIVWEWLFDTDPTLIRKLD